MYLTQGLHRHVQQRPDETATVCAGRTRTHAESVDRTARLAAALRQLGVRDGERAAVLGLNSDRYHEFLAAMLWAGGVVPVDVRWNVPEIADLLAEVDPLPLSPVGKVLKRELRRRYWAGQERAVH